MSRGEAGGARESGETNVKQILRVQSGIRGMRLTTAHNSILNLMISGSPRLLMRFFDGRCLVKQKLPSACASPCLTLILIVSSYPYWLMKLSHAIRVQVDVIPQSWKTPFLLTYIAALQITKSHLSYIAFFFPFHSNPINTQTSSPFCKSSKWQNKAIYLSKQ